MYGVLNSLGFGLIYMPAVIAVGFYFEKWRGVATGIATCGAGLGGVALPIIFTVIQDKVGKSEKHTMFHQLHFLLCLLTMAQYKALIN